MHSAMSDETMEYELADAKGRPWMAHPDNPFDCVKCGDGDALRANESCAYCGREADDE